jgi:hypothetical protein
MKFDDWVDVEGLAPAERERLQRMHELLLEAGPPATLPTGRENAPDQVAEVISLGRAQRRRRGLVALLAAAVLVAAAFAGGYFAGHGGGMHAVRQVSLQGTGGRSFASLAIGEKYSSGNWPIEMSIKGLPQQPNERAYYLLLLWRHGKPAGVCGAFRVSSGGSTKVHFDVPYKIDKSTRWVVTAIRPGQRYPGTVMMKTVQT